MWHIVPTTEPEKGFVLDNLKAFNRKVLGITSEQEGARKELNFLVKVDDRSVAGIDATLYFMQRVLFIDHLFVDEAYRKQGLGSKLLALVEEEARKAGVTLAHLDTFGWQAKDFYLKHGYQVFGELGGFPFGHSRYFLKKTLS